MHVRVTHTTTPLLPVTSPPSRRQAPCIPCSPAASTRQRVHAVTKVLSWQPPACEAAATAGPSPPVRQLTAAHQAAVCPSSSPPVAAARACCSQCLWPRAGRPRLPRPHQPPQQTRRLSWTRQPRRWGPLLPRRPLHQLKRRRCQPAAGEQQLLGPRLSAPVREPPPPLAPSSAVAVAPTGWRPGRPGCCCQTAGTPALRRTRRSLSRVAHSAAACRPPRAANDATRRDATSEGRAGLDEKDVPADSL